MRSVIILSFLFALARSAFVLETFANVAASQNTNCIADTDCNALIAPLRASYTNCPTKTYIASKSCGSEYMKGTIPKAN